MAAKISQLNDIRPSFNGSVRFEGRPEHLTSNAGALLLREVLERLGVRSLLEHELVDPRNPEAITHPQIELVMTLILLFALGWGDQDDADRFRQDPALRLAVSKRRGIRALEPSPDGADGREPSRNPPVPTGLASQPTLSRLLSVLAMDENTNVLRAAIRMSAAQRLISCNRGHRPRYVTIDLDSIPVEVHGSQPGSAYNGYYHRRVYHPLVASIGETGELLGLKLREGNAHTAAGSQDFILPLLDQVENELCQVASLRIDAGFPEETLLSRLEQRATPYVSRVKNNSVLDRKAQPFLKRPVGRRPAEPRMWLHEMTYQAESWSRARRVVLVVQEMPGKLLLHHFWLITNWSAEQMPAEDLLALYRIRGSAESRFGEFMSVLEPALSSTQRTKSHYRGKAPVKREPPVNPVENNEVLLLLHALAYNTMHAARTLLERKPHEGWSLRRFSDWVLRAPARVLVHSRRATVVVAEQVAVLWNQVWSSIHKLGAAPQPAS